MRAKVTDQGVTIPRQMLPDTDQVEIRSEGNVLIVSPVEDPIFGLGQAPVACDAPDASSRHDRFLYGSQG